jgi:hypothetical protein
MIFLVLQPGINQLYQCVKRNYNEAPTLILRLKKIEVIPRLPDLVVESIALGPIAIVLNAQ